RVLDQRAPQAEARQPRVEGRRRVEAPVLARDVVLAAGRGRQRELLVRLERDPPAVLDLDVRQPRRVPPRRGDPVRTHVPGRPSLTPGGAGLGERLTPRAAPRSPAPSLAVLCPPAVHRQRRPTNVRNLTSVAASRSPPAERGSARG